MGLSDAPGFSDLERRRVRVGGVELLVRTGGAGPPCLFLHGYPETGETWRHVVPALLPHRTVYVPDLRGWGESEKPPGGPYSGRVLLEDVQALIRELRLAPCDLVGHDWGAGVTLGVVLSHPELVRRAVTLNMGYRRFVKSAPLHFYFFNLPLLPELTLRLLNDAWVRLLLRWWGARREAFPEEVVRSYAEAHRRPGAREATIAYYRSLKPFRRRRGRPGRESPDGPRPEVQVPYLVIWGEAEKVSPLQNARWMMEDLAGVDLVTIPGVGHFPQEEAPAETARLIREFLLSGGER
jgi:haloacetate dehalogenase